MIRLNKAIDIVLNQLVMLKSKPVSLEEALFRVLSEDVFADVDFPSFDKTAVDGFAIRSQDIKKDWEVIEFIPAGKAPLKSIGEGECSRIMTGAMIPEGADMVVMLEHTETLENGRVKLIKTDSKANILKQGEDIKKGEIVLKKGTSLNSAHIGILASVGKTQPLVYQKANVGILSTGSELVEPSQSIAPPQIRNSNSYQIQAMCHQLGATTTNLGVVEDNPNSILQKINSLIENHEIIIFTGGASFGDHDFSEKVLKELGAEILIQKLAIQPGKPMLFARLGEKYLFGLSGNPVSSSIQFELLVKPLILLIMGNPHLPNIYQLPLTKDMERKKSERDLFFPVQVNHLMEVEPLNYHGSAHLLAYDKAEAIACFPIGKTSLKKGEKVDVRFL